MLTRPQMVEERKTLNFSILSRVPQKLLTLLMDLGLTHARCVHSGSNYPKNRASLSLHGQQGEFSLSG